MVCVCSLTAVRRVTAASEAWCALPHGLQRAGGASFRCCSDRDLGLGEAHRKESLSGLTQGTDLPIAALKCCDALALRP